MAMVVRSNLGALNANRQLGMNNSQVAKSLEKLSSGFRINRAGDDASGLAISEKMKAQIKGLEQASSNAQDGISLVQTAEGAMTEVHNMLNRMVELATKSSNGTVSDNVDRTAIQSEVDQLTAEIDRIGDATNFNGINLLDGNLGSKIGAPTDVSISTGVTITQNAAASGVFTTGGAVVGGDGTAQKLTVTIKNADGTSKDVKVDYTASTTPATNIDNIRTALAANDDLKDFNVGGAAGAAVTLTAKTAGSKSPQVTSVLSDDITGGANVPLAVGSTTTAATDSSKSLTTGAALADGTTLTIDGKTYEYNITGDVKKGNIAFVDQTSLIGEAKKNGITLTSTGPLTATATITIQHDATTANKGLSLQVGDTNDSFNKVTVNVDDVRSKGLGINGLDVSSREAASGSIQTIKGAINKVSTNRGNLGALQNRLEYAINNLDVTAENMTSANSRIRDTDMAKEMMNYTKMNVLTQAAQAMLAQANQQPQSILQLLQ